MNTRRTFLSFAAVTSLGLGLVACGGSTTAESGQTQSGSSGGTVTVGALGLASDASLRLAEEQGYLEEAGINSIEVKTVANPPAAIAAVQSGDIDVAYTPSVPFFNALNQGIDLTVVAAADGYPDDALEMDAAELDDTGVYVAAGSDISSPADLEGRKVSVPARKAQMEVTISETIRQDGGDPSKVQWMVLDPASALDSLKNGRIDAAALVSPFTEQAGAQGNTLLSSPGVAFFEKGAVGLWVAGTDQVEQDPAKYEAFREAMVKAFEYGNENTEEAQKHAAEITGVDLETIRQGATTYWPLETRLEDINRANEKMTELGYQPQNAPLTEDSILGAE
ncbi:ABC transporter substrate-binding protein [Citricoccus sp.]|uniref:ABC transporter substrate-binding protein n=1 Tax=Citricoccus sp. TaxID=1978372 RepID=UPI00262B31A8|nr:ABC transporter substrate-binding protein [Citricoccus sp.]HRO30704.1 ABC transporter substrate-binding protein [Citricoccus sp.]